MRELLAHRDFRNLFLAQCASLLGDSIFLVALAFAVLEATGSAAQLGTVLACGAALLVASFLVSGVWADRLPRLRVMIAADLVRLVSQLALAALLFTDRANLAWMIGLYGLSCIATAFFTPARTGLIPQLLEPRLLMAGNGMLASAHHGLAIAGFAGGGLLVAVAGSAGAIALDALTFGVSALLLLRIATPPTTVTAPRERFMHELAVGWREVATRRWLWLIVLGASIFLLTFEAPMQVVGPVVMRASYHGAATWGLLGAAIATGALIGAMVAPRAWLPRPMLVSICLFFATAVQPLLLLAHAPVWQLAAINVVVGMGNGMFDTVWHSSMQHQIPADRLARASAWDWMGSMAGMPIGFALAGFAVEHVGTRPTLIAMSVAALVICVGFLADREVRNLGSELRAHA